MLEVLRAEGVLSFLADQDAGERGMFVDSSAAPPRPTRRSPCWPWSTPVVVGYARRVGTGFRYEIGL